MSNDPEKLEKLAREKKVILTPCKNLPGNRSSSYDDRFILEIAANFDAAIISNDNFSDLLNENQSKFCRSVVVLKRKKIKYFNFFCLST